MNNVVLPSWTLILPESWDESKPNFKGEVDGFKSFPLLFKMAATINVPPSFRLKTPALQASNLWKPDLFCLLDRQTEQTNPMSTNRL